MPGQAGFGRWLLNQACRDDAIGLLARGAQRDPKFPRSKDTDTISSYIWRRHYAGIRGERGVGFIVDKAVAEYRELDRACF